MKRFVFLPLIFLLACAIALFFFNRYWTHRFDALVARQAAVYDLDPDLVWSVIYEETYFRPWMKGDAGEVGLMQVTPLVGREWAAETGMREFGRQMGANAEAVLSDPERNIQIGCWYLEKMFKSYRDVPGREARVLAAYNAGQSRVTEWERTKGDALTESQFIERIDFPTTRAYVSNILARYRELKTARKKDETNAKRVSSAGVAR
ncbi:MAG: lytic transglycosylase domain-containing protein [Pyrinomonadaceae bacterium]|nr:lytic transglycosylase domain-containing protein [Pyrinomonadaceae bacterium]